MPYLTPDDVPETTTCRSLLIPSSSEWLAIFSGALTELTYKYNWEQSDSGITVDEAIVAATAIISGYYDGCVAVGCQQPGGYAVFRINQQGRIEQLVNGEWVRPQDPYEIPPVPEREEATPEERQCLAARNAANVLEQGYEVLADAFAEGLTTSQAVVRLIEALAVTWFWLAPILNGLVLILAGFLEFVYQAFYYVTADVWDTDFTEILTCWLFECSASVGDTVTFDYDCLMGKMLSEVISPPFSEPMARLAVQLSYLIPVIGGVDFLEAAGATTEIETYDCSGCLDPCSSWLGGFGLGTMTPVQSSTYDAVNDWVLAAQFGGAWYASAIVPVEEGVEYTIALNGLWENQDSPTGTAQLFWGIDDEIDDLIEINTFPGMGDGNNSPFWHATPVPAGYNVLYVSLASIGGSSNVILQGLQICPV